MRLRAYPGRSAETPFGRRGCLPATRRRRLAAGFASPYRRDRLRSESEARFLRRIGTPEHLIGPVGSDEAVAAERAGLVEFARRRRSSASAA
jgi:hypothetical protein